MNRVIDSFTKEYFCFSNFFVEEDGLTVEHRFQASKSLDPEVQQTILAAKNPQQAKKLGKNKKFCKLRPDWEKVKDSIMEDLVLEKFTKYKVLRAELVATGDAELIEGNWWHDRVWGMVRGPSGKWVGENRLGKILMRVRDRLREQT